ncbi:FAD-dependent oxidoreductase [Roseobacter sp. YSTF-M11]|uniref:FAD-dependent oxidoreductase n=1 Tax=Roseobacter insulae TaxID=2859783 RepID=A0A9X1JXL3_9RHOB|nr:FAD-dependent oxidoreductase [Roseobacter insulae]MBW4707385.1 FAD-dependent oxidoreductase [Roseobacter insulae]
MDADILIVGGGLAGLAIAAHLSHSGHDFQLVEARHRLGGRIKTEAVDSAAFDMGPAWYWRGQPRVAALVQSLGLAPFEQQYQGLSAFEDETGRVQRGRGFASMQGSYRIAGGMATLTGGLAAMIADDRTHLGTSVTALDRKPGGVLATLSTGQRCAARQVILALPPRLAVDRIRFTPNLPEHQLRAMRETATWMAGQAKGVAVYDRPFWREAGLSGDASSRCGPMIEVHDASPAEDGPYALFGFIGLPVIARRDPERLTADILTQLGRLFGPEAAVPRQIFLKDWALDHWTATGLDHAPLYAHPDYGRSHKLAGAWEDVLVLSGTETAPQFGGYLEGALEAAENTLKHIDIRYER